MFAPHTGYDQAITIFSPDGRLFQVEYAVEAVRRGTSAIGVKVKEGVVLAVEKRLTSSLMEINSVTKVYVIDEHVGAAIAGLHADARRLIDYARIQAQINRLYYEEPITIEQLTKAVCDLKQNYTQSAGVRPFGVALLIAGVDATGPRLFSTHPSGAYWEWQATAIGRGAQRVNDMLEKEYKKEFSLDEAIKLALKSLKEIAEKELEPDNVELAVATIENKVFEKMRKDEISKWLSSL
ncbi:MAG: archaeal proteasome endopeptidase complex subunit alpha [Candidatus Baldrarchaeota archaeon]